MNHVSKKPTRYAPYLVHIVTALGIIPAALAMREITSLECDARWVFGYLLLATFIDAVDGPLARRFDVKRRAPKIDGRTVDDLLDYLTFAFIPLMLTWRMQWLPEDWGWLVILAMGASLFGFSHQGAKEEAHGFFRGFPSYWNIFAFYAGILYGYAGPWPVAVLLVFLSILTVAPVLFIYPNLAPDKHRGWLLGGAVLWVLLMLWLLTEYSQPRGWLVLVSLIYPIAYTIASFLLAAQKKKGDGG